MADYLILPPSLATPLDAVNVLIRSTGEAPVATIDPPTHQDAEDALSELNLANLEVQTKGWAWNREYDYPLSLDGDSKAPLPDLTLKATRAKSETQYTRITQRGNFMYNRELRSMTFSRAPIVDLIMFLPWEEIPQAARAYITLLACQRFQAQKTGEQIVQRVNDQAVYRALVTLEQQEDEDEGNNTTYSTPTLVALNGNGGLVRNRQGIL